MKRYLLFLLSALMSAFSTFADADLEFRFDQVGRTCTLTDVKNASGDVVIPSKVEKDGVEYTVTELGPYLFFESCSLESLSIPESITKIEGYFFYSAGSVIQTLFYNATCADVASNAFNTGSIKDVIVGRNVKRVPRFSHPDRVDYTLEFTQGVDSIAALGKDNIIHLTDIDEWAMNPPAGFQPLVVAWVYTNPLQLKNIKGDYNGQPVKNLTFGSKVTKIAPGAFAGFSDIQSITLHDYITEIGDGAFAGTSITSLSIPESITEIGDYSFAGCLSLTDVTLPSSISSFGDGIFACCSALYNIQLPQNLEKISLGFFYGCSDLEEVILPESLTTIGEMAFQECGKLKLPDFPATLVAIESSAYYGNNFSGELKFSSNLRNIGNRAFIPAYPYNGGTGLSIHFSEGLESIGNYAFANADIKDINLPQSLTSIGERAFYRTKLSSIVIPDGITKIPDSAFEGSTLKYITLPGTLEEIGAKAFYDTYLTEISLPESLRIIGSESIYLKHEYSYYNYSLNAVKIPDAVTSIGENALGNVSYLTIGNGINSIEYPIAKAVDVLEMKTSTPPALGTDRLGFSPKIVIVPEGAESNYTSSVRWKDYNISARNSRRATVFVDEPGTFAVECRIQTGFHPGQITNLIVEGSLNDEDFAVMRSNMTACYSIDLSKVSNTEIPDGAFSEKNTLLEMTLPDNTQIIGSYAFNNCYVMNIKSIPEHLETIGSYAFYNCRNLSIPLEFPSTLKEVSVSAFSGCSSIPSADFSACPDAVFPYGSIFESCKNLRWVSLPGNLTRIPGATFYEAGLRSVEIPSSVSYIGDKAFAGTDMMKDVAFSESLESIGKQAFANSGIESVDLPASLKSISEGAFSESSLVFANIKDGLEDIAKDVFKNCSDLMVVNLPSTLKSIAADALASPSLTAITSPSSLPAATKDNPFTGVNNYNCALTIPKASYSQYLSAEFWGAFVNIRNWIDVTIPEITDDASSSDNDDNLEITYIDENDYQSMIRDEMQDAEENEGQNIDGRRNRLRILSRVGAIGKSHGYGRLFNGASLFAADGSRTRIFINAPESFENLKVFYNGKDVTSEIDPETMSFVTPELSSISSLEIKGDYSINGIMEIEADKTTAPVYTLTGTIAGYGKESLGRLPAGIYVFCGRKIIIK